jgi:hypothetical protein
MQRLLLTCLCVLALAASAHAQGPRVDPDSPAGSEYQLPVERAREQARERPTPQAGSSDGERGARAPLFGSGVQEREPAPDRPRAAGEPAKADRRRERGRTAEPEPAPELRPDLGTATPEVRAQAAAPDDGGSGVATIAGAALGMLLLGGLGGLAWRRRTVRR